MTDLESLDLECLGKIIVKIRLHKQQCVDGQDDIEVSAYLKDTLQTGDFLFWQIVQSTFTNPL